MGACRAVSRMRRRSRARRPAHGVCVVSFLRLAQRSRRAARSTRDAPARAHARRRLAACPWFAPGVAHMRLARVSGGRLAVGFGRDGKQACARGAHAPRDLCPAWASGARMRAHGAGEGACVARPGISLRPVRAARRVAPPAAFVPCVFERPCLPCCRPRACAGLAAPVQPHACPAGRAFGLPARRASSVRRFCLLSSDGACERAAPRAAF